jgi:macrolide transport system ATP-binding/permease protein
VSSGYFTTLQARLIRGRFFHETEDAAKPRVAIVNRTFATKYFAGEDPMGKRIYYDWEPRMLMEVVGIVEDIKEGPLENANWPVLYVPFDQNPVGDFAILVRASTTEQSALPSIAATIRQIDPDISVNGGTSMTERIHNSPAAYLHRSSTWLVGIFAAVAFLLAVVGLYGVIAYSVSQRTREIGVRIALGARPGSVHKLIVKEGARLAVMGTALGLLCSAAATALMRRLLFGIDSSDIATLAAVVAAVLIFSALLASYNPARRATSVNPMEALRSE